MFLLLYDTIKKHYGNNYCFMETNVGIQQKPKISFSFPIFIIVLCIGMIIVSYFIVGLFETETISSYKRGFECGQYIQLEKRNIDYPLPDDELCQEILDVYKTTAPTGITEDIIVKLDPLESELE